MCVFVYMCTCVSILMMGMKEQELLSLTVWSPFTVSSNNGNLFPVESLLHIVHVGLNAIPPSNTQSHFGGVL